MPPQQPNPVQTPPFLVPDPLQAQSLKLPPWPTHRQFPIKRLTPSQLQERRDKGLFYNCDERYTLGHKRNNKFLLWKH